jgi:hypothetical protein
MRFVGNCRKLLSGKSGHDEAYISRSPRPSQFAWTKLREWIGATPVGLRTTQTNCEFGRSATLERRAIVKVYSPEPLRDTVKIDGGSSSQPAALQQLLS